MSEPNNRRFVEQVHGTGGASMDLRGRLLQPRQFGYMVGGEPDRAGNQISSYSVPENEFSAEHVTKFMDYTRSMAHPAARNIHVGAWKNDGEVVMDVSRRVKRAKQAKRLGKQRNQIAVWDNRHMREIPTGGTGD